MLRDMAAERFQSMVDVQSIVLRESKKLAESETKSQDDIRRLKGSMRYQHVMQSFLSGLLADRKSQLKQEHDQRTLESLLHRSPTPSAEGIRFGSSIKMGSSGKGTLGGSFLLQQSSKRGLLSNSEDQQSENYNNNDNNNEQSATGIMRSSNSSSNFNSSGNYNSNSGSGSSSSSSFDNNNSMSIIVPSLLPSSESNVPFAVESKNNPSDKERATVAAVASPQQQQQHPTPLSTSEMLKRSFSTVSATNEKQSAPTPTTAIAASIDHPSMLSPSAHHRSLTIDEELALAHYNSAENVRKREEEMLKLAEEQAAVSAATELRQKLFNEYWASMPVSTALRRRRNRENAALRRSSREEHDHEHGGSGEEQEEIVEGMKLDESTVTAISDVPKVIICIVLDSNV